MSFDCIYFPERECKPLPRLIGDLPDYEAVHKALPSYCERCPLRILKLRDSEVNPA